MSLRNGIKIGLLGFFAALVGVVSSLMTGIAVREMTREDVENWQGLTQDGANYTLRSHLTQLGVSEHGIDKDDNGFPEEHVVYINEAGDFFALLYTILDANGDGEPERLAIQIGPDEGHTTYSAVDSDNDGHIDYVRLSLGNLRTGADDYWKYQDYNMDGRLDLMQRVVEGVLKESYVFHENTLYPAKEILDGEKRIVLVGDYEGNMFKVQFQGHSWIRLDPG